MSSFPPPRLLSLIGWPALFIILSLGFSIATGPFRAADEPGHFFRAYEISEGHFVARRVGPDLLGDYLPASLPKMAKILAGFPHDPIIHTSQEALAEARRLDLKRGHRTFVHFPGAAMHSPLLYAPAALGMALGRRCHGGPLTLFYLARFANALVAGGLAGWALRRVWARAPFLAAIALFPMCLSQMGAIGADALTLAIGFYWLSEILQARAPGSVTIRFQGRWLLFAAALSQIRFPYPLLGLLILSVPQPSLGIAGKTRGRFYASFFVLLIAPSVAWIAIIKGLNVQMRPLVQVDPAAQLHFVLGQPLYFLDLIRSGLAHLGFVYWHEAVGVLGWLSFPVPLWVLYGVTLTLLVTLCSSKMQLLNVTPGFRFGAFFLAISGLLLTAILTYLTWNSVGAGQIEGWQGRYALPFLPVLILAFANGLLSRFAWVACAAIGFSTLADLAVIASLARATYLVF